MRSEKTAVCDPENQTHSSGTWKIASTSVCGSSHEKLGIPCQDAHFWFVQSDQTLLVAVADGAGSAKHSDIGAKIATQTAVETLRYESDLACRMQNDPETFRFVLQKALKAALAAVKTEAKVQHIHTRDLASTLIVAIATPQVVAAAQIGDGAVVIQSEELIALTTPDHGEYINQTTFLITPKAITTAQMHIYYGHISHLAIFSDGLQMLALAMPFGNPHAPFFSPLFRFISEAQNNADEHLASFLRSHRVRERTDDDLTLFLSALTDCDDATQSQ